jgi:hypothetical protein
MKTTRKIFNLSFVVSLAAYVGLYLVFNLIKGQEIDLISMFSIGVGISIIYSLIFYAGINISLKPRFAYLESDETSEPVFGDKNEKIIEDKKQPLNIKEIKSRIQKKEKWKLTHFNEDKNMLRFRSKRSFNSWGIGVVLKIDNDNHPMKIISYPIQGYTHKGRKLSKQAIEEIEVMILNG